MSLALRTAIVEDAPIKRLVMIIPMSVDLRTRLRMGALVEKAFVNGDSLLIDVRGCCQAAPALSISLPPKTTTIKIEHDLKQDVL